MNKTYFSYLFIFFLGAISMGLFLNYQGNFFQSTQNKEESDSSPQITPSPTMALIKEWVEATPANQTYNFSSKLTSKKYTIEEVGKISADKSEAQTGETVNFSVTLKNSGSEKKFLTHICFNYNGGNFGCVRNINIYPGDSFNVNNSMMFPSPGIQSVWVTWSQDGNNFYRPTNSGTTRVSVI